MSPSHDNPQPFADNAADVGLAGLDSTTLAFHVPARRLSNEELARCFPDFSPAKIQQKVGIIERRIAGDGETAVDLAEQAASLALRGVDPASIDYVLLCTLSPDYALPASACLLQHRLGLPRSVGAIDINQGCSGFVYGLQLAQGLVSSAACRNVLLVTTDAFSRYLAEDDKANRSIFGDGAAACLIRAGSGDLTIGRFVVGTDGSGCTNLWVPRGGFRHPGLPEGRLFPVFHMNGPEVFHFTLQTVPGLIDQVLQRNGLKMSEIDLFVFHQANKYMLDRLRTKLGIEKQKFCICLEDYGNTISSTIPIALCELLAAKRIQPSMKILLAGFGVGYSWAGTVLTVGKQVDPVHEKPPP